MEKVYKYLEPRPDSKRNQYYIKGRNITAGQLVRHILANDYTPAQAADNFELPLEAVEEAIEYYKENEDMIAAEFLERFSVGFTKGNIVIPASI
jgi:hypothetical protein